MPNKKLISIAILCFSLFLVAFLNVSLVSAEDPKEPIENCSIDFDQAAKDASLLAYCPYKENSDLKQYESLIQTESETFNQFIEQTFQSKQPNSGLIDTAMNKYSQVKAKILSKQTLILDALKTTGCSQDQVLGAYLKCQSLADEALTKMYIPLKRHVISTAEVKRTTVLLDKYQALNSKLRDLNGKMAETYGYYATFSKKFKGYVPTCE